MRSRSRRSVCSTSMISVSVAASSCSNTRWNSVASVCAAPRPPPGSRGRRRASSGSRGSPRRGRPCASSRCGRGRGRAGRRRSRAGAAWRARARPGTCAARSAAAGSPARSSRARSARAPTRVPRDDLVLLGRRLGALGELFADRLLGDRVLGGGGAAEEVEQLLEPLGSAGQQQVAGRQDLAVGTPPQQRRPASRTCGPGARPWRALRLSPGGRPSPGGALYRGRTLQRDGTLRRESALCGWRAALGSAGALPFTSGFGFSVGAGLAATASPWPAPWRRLGLRLRVRLGGAGLLVLFFAGFVLLAMPTSVLPSAREELVVVRSRVGLIRLWRPYA